ncbi:MAG: ABC transporter ATP-binding protein [Sedimentisphaeraceae bacterium JB056]
MLKRFIKYYRPHLRLFILDMSAAVIASLISVLIPVLTRKLLKDYLPAEDIAKIWQMIAIMMGMIVISSILSYIRVRWGHTLGVRMEADMRSDIFSHIQKLSFNYFDNVKTGHIMSRISNDLNQIAEIAHHAPEDLIISSIVIIGALVAMFMFSVPLAIIALFPLTAIILWGIFYGGSMKKGFRQVRKKIAEINSSVENSVQGIREVKAFANEPEEIVKFGEVNTSFRSAKESMYGIMSIFFAVMMLLTESYFLIIIGGGTFLIIKGTITTADLIPFILYIHFILKPINRLVNFTEQLQRGAACFERFIEVMDIEPDIVDSPDARDIEKIDGQIKLENLTFRYKGFEEDVLNNVNIQVPKGKTIAIVGESGAGKSTIASLIPRFYETETGKILIDNHNINEIKQRCLRRNIGIVQQNVFLFDSTIRDNIMYGNFDATEQQLYEAAKKANIYDFIVSLPDGFDTLVGERGVKLSGGQKQRISVARVFLKNPPIFIFDEATSSLDSESEALIQRSLELLSTNRTTIIIAHRLSTIKKADHIYVLRKGKVVEDGTHQQLMDRKDYYHSLYSISG